MAIRVVPTSYATIELALAACNDGDTIRVDSGVLYSNEDLNDDSAKSNITFINNTGGDVEIRIKSGSSFAPGKNWIIGQQDAGFDFTRLSYSGSTVIYINKKTGVKFYSCSFNNTAGGNAVLVVAGVSYPGTASAYFYWCYFRGNYVTLTAPTAIDLRGNSNYNAYLYVEDCTFDSNYSVLKMIGVKGLAYFKRNIIKSVYRPFPIDNQTVYSSPSSWLLDARFNIIYDGGAGNIGAAIYDNHKAGNTPSILFYRNIVADGFKIVDDNAGQPNASMEVKGNWGELTDIVSGADYAFNSTTATPGFTDYAGHDYTLTAGSPLIDAGFDTGDLTDFIGNPTPIGQADIGAYETCPVITWGSGSLAAECITEEIIRLSWDLTDVSGPITHFNIYDSASLLGSASFDEDEFYYTGSDGQSYDFNIEAVASCGDDIAGPSLLYTIDCSIWIDETSGCPRYQPDHTINKGNCVSSEYTRLVEQVPKGLVLIRRLKGGYQSNG